MTAAYVLLQVGAVLLLIAIFGVAAASFVLRHERPGDRKALPEKEKKHQDPYAIVWWQNLQDLGYEFHLANGEVWRGRIAWHRYPDGTSESHSMPMQHWNRFDNYRRRIEWKEPEIWALHAHVLVDWSPLERAYQLKLLNGSVWQFNTKSEGLSENNRMAWHRISSPEGIVFESLDSIHTSLNAHLEQIRATEKLPNPADPQNAHADAPGFAQLLVHDALSDHVRANNLILEQLRAKQHGASYSNRCGVCSLRPVSIPGGICHYCRSAQGSNV